MDASKKLEAWSCKMKLQVVSALFLAWIFVDEAQGISARACMWFLRCSRKCFYLVCFRLSPKCFLLGFANEFEVFCSCLFDWSSKFYWTTLFCAWFSRVSSKCVLRGVLHLFFSDEVKGFALGLWDEAGSVFRMGLHWIDQIKVEVFSSWFCIWLSRWFCIWSVTVDVPDCYQSVFRWSPILFLFGRVAVDFSDEVHSVCFDFTA